MISTSCLSLFIALLGISGTVVQAVEDDTLSSSHRQLQEETFAFGYIEPAWYDRIEAEFTGANLKRCTKRNPNGIKPAPASGESCSAAAKTCFFGTQECPEVGPHPVFRCSCDGAAGSQTWSCPSLACPVGCPPEGTGFEFFNDPACPATPQGSPCTAAIDGLSCNYGREDCCGRCNASQRWTCEGSFGGWIGLFTDACFGPCQCPAEEERTTAVCHTEGKQCSYTYDPEIPEGSCVAEDVCTCTTFGTYSCETTISCVSIEPPEIEAPATSVAP